MAATQLVIYPFFEKRFGASTYGEILVVIGIYSIFVSVFTNTLANARLMLNKKRSEECNSGNFNPLCFIFSFVSSIGAFLVCLFIFPWELITLVGVAILTFLMALRTYCFVHFRLSLSFVKMLIANVLLTAGYLAGLFLIPAFNFWPFVFVLGELICMIFIIFATGFLKEKWSFNSFSKIIILTDLPLIAIAILGSSLSYCDRLIIFPLLGSAVVTIYTVACFMGKLLSATFEPMSIVVLSYCTNKQYNLSRKAYIIISIVAVLGSTLLLFLAFLISPFILEKLYPDVYSEALPFVLLASVSYIFVCSESIIRPINLSNGKQKSLLLIQLIYFCVYVGLSIIFVKFYGLNGFCFASIISNALRFLLQFLIGLYYFAKKGRDNENGIDTTETV